MNHTLFGWTFIVAAWIGLFAGSVAVWAQPAAHGTSATDSVSVNAPGLVQCANLVYGRNRTSHCFSDHFMRDVAVKTNIATASQFSSVNLESISLFDYPFAVMTGEGRFELTPEQRVNLRNYLTFGGFVVASAGCSCPIWSRSFRREIAEVFPEAELTPIDISHPIFSTVYHIESLPRNVQLEGLEIDGKIVLVFSPDGLNDTREAPAECCCCGGSEIKSARQINANLLVYSLTH